VAALFFGSTMLKAVSQVSKALAQECVPHELDLERITSMFEKITAVDEVVFVRYNTAPQNPFWGEFTRWTMQPAVYAAFKTMVEIRYASHLLDKEDWLRFVVCKELCHSLEAPSGKHDVSERGVDDLVDKFSLISASKAIDDITASYQLEILAEVGAVELLCPLNIRKQIIAETGSPDATKCKEIAAKYNLPFEYVLGSFDPGHMSIVEHLMNGG